MTRKDSILATLAYHDIFEYPLKLPEIEKFLIGDNSKLSLRETIKELINQKKIGQKKDYFFLKNRSKIVKIRLDRARYSKTKFKKAKSYASLLKVIPTIKLVALSGALAMENSHKGDDVDFVIITKKGTLWTTRFLANSLLLPFKRDPQGKKIADRACLNIFIDEQDLKIKNQNLYTAHEIAQMKPLWDRDQMYPRFIRSNQWIGKYLPNWKSSFQSPVATVRKTNWSLVPGPWSLAESLLKNFQLWYMRSKITTEKVSNTQLFFHPIDTQSQILDKFGRKLNVLKVKY